MPVYRLDERLAFPPPDHADESGLLAVGGDLRPERLLLAYAHGIFPWYADGLPILWHSPDPRMVLRPGDLHVPRRLRKTIRKRPFELSFDTVFPEVIDACASSPRPDQEGTWITDDMRGAYIALHERGYAHSAEAWRHGELVGGLYGVALGAAFFGESMFARASDASKVAFVDLVRHLDAWGFEIIDCQVYTEHLASFGAAQWPRRDFLSALRRALEEPTRPSAWSRTLESRDQPAA